MNRTIRLTMFAVLTAFASQLPAAAQKTIALTWTIYPTYTDPATGTVQTSAIVGDGKVSGANGSTVYTSNNKSQSYVDASLKTPDAVLSVGGSRSISVSLARFLGSDYAAPSSSFTLVGQVLNINAIQQCQSDGCVFYTVMTTTYLGSDGNYYGLPMRSLDVDINWPPQPEANCMYKTSRVRVEFHLAGHSGFTKNTWLVTPELQSTLTPGYIPSATWGGTQAGSCPGQTVLGNSDASAAVATLLRNMGGTYYNYGQYNLPFYFKIEQN